MAKFSYKAKKSDGTSTEGIISESSKIDAKKRLQRLRLKSIKLTKMAKNTQNSSGVVDTDRVYLVGKLIYKDPSGIQINLFGDQKATTKDLIIFTKQLATMINSGVAIIQSLDLLAKQQGVRSFKLIIEQVKRDIESGKTLSAALESHPSLFDNLYVSMVSAGEASGSLEDILVKLAVYIEKAEKIKAQVKSSMRYPVIVLCVALVVVTGLLIGVVPMFAQQFTDAGKELPGVTAFIMDISNGMQAYWMHIFGTMFMIFVIFKWYIKTQKGHIWFDKMLLKLPGLGILLKKIAVGRFCSTMSTMLSSGVNMLAALDICAKSSGNLTIENFITEVKKKIEAGEKMSVPLAEGDLFPEMVVSMIAVGETTGAIDEMLYKISEFYEEEVDLAVEAMLGMIEPIMIVFVGGLVGFIVIAMYLPMFDMASVVG